MIQDRMMVNILLIAALFFGPSLRTPQTPEKKAAAQVELARLLRKAADYCRKLEGAALDFVCREEIAEAIDPSLDVKRPRIVLSTWTAGTDAAASTNPRDNPVFVRPFVRKIKRTLIYDYQCIRGKGEMTERRTLLQEDRKKVNEPEAKLKTRVLLYKTPLLGPIGFFGADIQPYFEYAVVGREKYKKNPVVIVEATPKPNAPPANELYGKAWIDPGSGDIVKIEWNDKRIGHFEVFEKRGEKYGLKPRITLTSEFEVAKNGLRFPSRFNAEEVYVSEHGRAFVRSTTAVEYKDFKFFTVEVDVR